MDNGVRFVALALLQRGKVLVAFTYAVNIIQPLANLQAFINEYARAFLISMLTEKETKIG